MTLAALRANLAQPGPDLVDALVRAKPVLARVLDAGVPNPADQRDLHAGSIAALAVNADFARHALFLAAQLACAEKHIAPILAGRTADAAVLEFHQRRRDLVDCLRLLLDHADAAERPAPPRLALRLDAFLRRELVPAGLAPRVFAQLDALGPTIAQAQLARQHAPSATVLSATQPALAHDVLAARCDSLKYERRQLAIVFHHLARLGCLAPADVHRAVDWLAANPADPLALYVLAAVLAAFGPADPHGTVGKARVALARDRPTIAHMSRQLAAPCRDPGLRATLALGWSLFMADTRHRDPALENEDGFRTDELAAHIAAAVQGDALAYLAAVLVHLHARTSTSPVSAVLHDRDQPREPLADEFRLPVLDMCDTVVRALLTHASSELRKIKQRQEDLLATVRTDRARLFRSAAPDNDRNDIAVLYALIGLLYAALPPERALQFWGASPLESHALSYLESVELSAGKLPSFLQWAVWSTHPRDVHMSTALYDMLAGLAHGQQCSELAYNFLARGAGEVVPGSSLPTPSYSASISWSAIFGLLDAWASPSSSARPNQPPQQQSLLGSLAAPQPPAPTPQQPQHIPIGPKDVLLAQSFLRLLATVARSSVAVRLAIAANTQFRAIPTLIALVPLGVPLELKGALFDALAAFGEPGAGVAGVDICKNLWSLMERVEVINVRASPRSAGAAVLPPVKGVELELDEVEAVYKLYPATIPFLNLLATLLHTPKRLSPRSLLADAEPLNTVPEALGQPYRLPGIGPYVAFVVDNVFAGLPRREYARPSERWRMNDLCLAFVERALAGWEIETIVRGGDDTLKRDTVLPLLTHPGFDVLSRLLTATPLQSTVLSYLVDGLDAFELDLPAEEPFFLLTIVRVLRIVLRVLEIQDVFLDVLVPLLAEFDSAPLVGAVHPRSYYTRLDQALAYGTKYIPALAAYVVYPYPELVLLAVKIVTQLAASPAVNLVTLVERSADSERILSGFRQLLEVECLDDVEAAEAAAEQSTGAGAPDGADAPLDQAIRTTILDLFVRTTRPGASYPNIGHFLLFGGTDGEHQIEDPHAAGGRRTCVHVLLDLVNQGVPRKRTDEPLTTPLYVVLPALSERCYRVLYQLCVHPRTSDATLRYLHTREDFFARHLAAIPARVPSAPDAPVEVRYHDGALARTSVGALRAFLGLRAAVLDLAALALHVLAGRGHHRGVLEILEIAFGAGDDADDGGQPQLRLVEWMHALAFDWSDALTTAPVELVYLAPLNLHACLRADAVGCEVVDQGALLTLLTGACRALHAQGRITTGAQAAQLAAETTYVLESCAIENHRRTVAHGVGAGYDAWRRLLDTALTRCFDRLPHDRRESMLFELLHVIPGRVRDEVVPAPTAVLLAEAALSAVTRLRADRRHQVLLQSAGGDVRAGSLPTERLYALLRSLLDGVLAGGGSSSELVRGNLYACLIHYLHLIGSGDDDGDGDNWRQYAADNDDDDKDDDKANTIETGTLGVFRGVMERLVGAVARDAIDGAEVWKTVAFMLLDALAHLGRADKSRAWLGALVRHGVLGNVVRGLKETEAALQQVLKPDPEDLNPLYVYEAKMSLFLRMAQTRAGAERLLEAQIVPVLAQCEYLDTRPEEDQSFMDQDSFLPSAVQRYHQLFMPAVQLVVAMLASLGAKHTTVHHQALEFLSSHKDTIVIMLKNDTEEVTLSYIEEVHLLLSLSGSLLPLIPKSELLTMNTGFGSVHGAILGLAARCLSNGQWGQSVRPQTDAEIALASAFAPGRPLETQFDVAVHHQELLLRKAVIEYLGTASDFTEPEMMLVLSPVLSVPRPDGTTTRVMATIPTIGDAIEALSGLSDDLSATLKQIADLSAELSSQDHIRVDTLHEVVRVSDPAFLQDLDMVQKRSLMYQAYERLRGVFRAHVRTVLGTTEMLLLLLWRHLASYTDADAGAATPTPTPTMVAPPNLRSSLRLLPALDVGVFKSEAGSRLVGVLSRISSLDLNEETVGRDWQSYQGYIEIMSRRLRDTVGLHELE